jgi:hypothetical protein
VFPGPLRSVALAFWLFNRLSKRARAWRLLVDDAPVAKAVLDGLHMILEETDVAVVRLPHRPGELGRAASLPGENGRSSNFAK